MDSWSVPLILIFCFGGPIALTVIVAMMLPFYWFGDD